MKKIIEFILYFSLIYLLVVYIYLMFTEGYTVKSNAVMLSIIFAITVLNLSKR